MEVRCRSEIFHGRFRRGVLWDNWLDARRKAMINAMIDREIIPLADAIGTKTGKFVVEQRKLREEFGAMTDKLRDKLKEFAVEKY
jgi:hypothetical protein